MCSGRFDYAKEMLLSALSVDNALQPLPKLRTYRTPSSYSNSAKSKNSSNNLVAQNIGIQSGGIWKRFKYVLLRKLLLCARVLSDAQLYVEVSLRLLDPDLTEMMDQNTAISIFGDVVKISKSTMTDAEVSFAEYLPSILAAPMLPHVSAAIKFYSPQEKPDHKSDLKAVTLKSVTSIIHDEPFKVTKCAHPNIFLNALN
jgi:hypothetical protein